MEELEQQTAMEIQKYRSECLSNYLQSQELLRKVQHALEAHMQPHESALNNKRDISEIEFANHLRRHIMTPDNLRLYGYPNGPSSDYLHTQPRYDKPIGVSKVYALDCELCNIGRGPEVTKVSLVGYNRQVVYDFFVQPTISIVDYNTRSTGITASDLCKQQNKNLKTLDKVQKDLLQLIDADAILIGHGLENDLRALRIIHKQIVDTSCVFPHPYGFPYCHSLKELAVKYLKRDIQWSNAGHDSVEDSLVSLDLMRWKVHNTPREWLLERIQGEGIF